MRTFLFTLPLMLLMAGCLTVGQHPDGSYFPAIDLSPSLMGEMQAQEIGGIAETGFKFLGVPAPIATGIGALITGGLGIYGHISRVQAAHLKGHSDGWDEREQAASIQKPLKSRRKP